MPNFAGKCMSNQDGAKMMSFLNLGYLIFQLMYAVLWYTSFERLPSSEIWFVIVEMVGTLIALLAYGAVLYGLIQSNKKALIGGLVTIAIGGILCLAGQAGFVEFFG